MKRQQYEERLREDLDNLRGLARWGSDKLRQLENFFGSYEGPKDFGDRGIKCALNHVRSDEVDSVVKIVSFLEGSIKRYQALREAHFQGHYSDLQKAERAGWKPVGDDFPMKFEFLKEVERGRE